MKTTLKLVLIAIISLYSCKKDTPIDDNYKINPSAEKTVNLSWDSIAEPISGKDLEYMNSLPNVNLNELHNELKKSSSQNSGNRSEEVWGIGTGYTVWKWNGASWGQPNSAARLRQVEVAKNGDGSVWGIGTNNTVWKWNGASWGQPNSAARLHFIAVHSSNVAIGVGSNGTLFITINGGQNWGYLDPNFTGAKGLSCGGSYPDGFLTVSTKTELYKYDVVSGLNLLSTPFSVAVGPHATMFQGGIWAIDWSPFSFGDIYRSMDYVNFSQPNSGAHLLKISSNNNQIAWGIAGDRSVWKTSNAGVSWSQPNHAARLDYISYAH